MVFIIAWWQPHCSLPFGILEIPIASAVVFPKLPHHAKPWAPGHCVQQSTQPTSSLFHSDLRGPAVGHRLHDALMPFKCIAMTWLVNLSTCQRLCLLKEASESFPSLGQNSRLCLERRMQ